MQLEDWELMRTCKKTGSLTSTAFVLILVMIALGSLFAFQQNYAKSRNIGIEQPVGWFGLAEYFFRHPEKLFGQ